jgi:hypothetical protein
VSAACRCPDLTELYGDEAESYARDHLYTDEVRTDAFEELLSCPDTGTLWLLDYPERTEREPGQARLGRRAG